MGQDSYRDVYTALFVPCEGHLVVFRVNSPDRPGTVQRLRLLGQGLQFDVPAPAPSPVVATESPRPTTARGGFDWERWLQPVILPGLFLLFTALPAWVGAASATTRPA